MSLHNIITKYYGLTHKTIPMKTSLHLFSRDNTSFLKDVTKVVGNKCLPINNCGSSLIRIQSCLAWYKNVFIFNRPWFQKEFHLFSYGDYFYSRKDIWVIMQKNKSVAMYTNSLLWLAILLKLIGYFTAFKEIRVTIFYSYSYHMNHMMMEYSLLHFLI